MEQVEAMPAWEFVQWQWFFNEMHRQEQQAMNQETTPKKRNLLAMTDEELIQTYGKPQS